VSAEQILLVFWCQEALKTSQVFLQPGFDLPHLYLYHQNRRPDKPLCNHATGRPPVSARSGPGISWKSSTKRQNLSTFIATLTAQQRWLPLQLPFESLPDDIFLRIIVRVPFSYENFQALRLTNLRIPNIMSHRGGKLLEDVAEVQFPLALWAWTMFKRNRGIRTLRWLGGLDWTTSEIAQDVSFVDSIRYLMTNQESSLGLALGP
jgi:hypothetical protein